MIYIGLCLNENRMSLQRKWYSISSITWFVMILLLVGAYYWLRPNYNMFYIVAGVFMAILLVIWFLTRRNRMKRDEDIGIFLSMYHKDVLDNREEVDLVPESESETSTENTVFQQRKEETSDY